MAAAGDPSFSYDAVGVLNTVTDRLNNASLERRIDIQKTLEEACLYLEMRWDKKFTPPVLDAICAFLIALKGFLKKKPGACIPQAPTHTSNTLLVHILTGLLNSYNRVNRRNGYFGAELGAFICFLRDDLAFRFEMDFSGVADAQTAARDTLVRGSVMYMDIFVQGLFAHAQLKLVFPFPLIG